MMQKFREVTIEDIMENPNAYGAPTFEQFRKNPDKWRLPKDHLFLSADRGSDIFKDVRKHNYYFHREGLPTKCRSLEDVEAVCKLEGIKPDELEMKVFKETVDGKTEMNVHFRKKPNVA